jgi:hypothetical protein
MDSARDGTSDHQAHQTLGLRSPDGTEIKPAKIAKTKQFTRYGRRRLVNRTSLDGRTAVAKVYDQLVAQIHADLGGRDRLSAIELSLVEAFAGASVTLDHINTRLLSGAEVTQVLVGMAAVASSTMVRVANKLGIERRAKIVPSLDEFLAMRARARGEKPKEEIVE